jgi:hypothetical protein
MAKSALGTHLVLAVKRLLRCINTFLIGTLVLKVVGQVVLSSTHGRVTMPWVLYYNPFRLVYWCKREGMGAMGSVYFSVSRAVDLGGGSEEVERSDILNNCE